MKLKKYFEFKNDNLSFGQWVASLYDDDNIKNIINQYLKDIDPTISLVNCLNLLDVKTKNYIRELILNYQQNGVTEKKPNVNAHVLEESNLSGKGIFTTFLKCLTALGLKDNKTDKDKCNDEFIFYHEYQSNLQDVKLVFKRFQSLENYINIFDENNNDVKLYYGLKLNGVFEYGLVNDEHSPIGNFKMNKSTLKWLINLNLKSLNLLKKELVNLSFEKLNTLSNIKKDLLNFNPDKFDKRILLYDNDILSLGFYGLGRWENSEINKEDLEKFKTLFNNYCISKKWGSEIKFSIKTDSFWTYFNVKIKN